MQVALDRADYEEIAVLGHNLRGSGGGFGHQPITDIGAGLEKAAEDCSVEVAQGWIAALTRYLDAVDPSPDVGAGDDLGHVAF